MCRSETWYIICSFLIENRKSYELFSWNLVCYLFSRNMVFVHFLRNSFEDHMRIRKSYDIKKEMKLFHFEVQLWGEWSGMEAVMPGSHVNNYISWNVDQYVILETCIERMYSTMEQKILFSSGFLSFCLEENFHCLSGYKLKMFSDLAHLHGRISAVIVDIGLKRRAQRDIEYLAECLEIVNSKDTGLEFWYVS